MLASAWALIRAPESLRMPFPWHGWQRVEQASPCLCRNQGRVSPMSGTRVWVDRVKGGFCYRVITVAINIFLR